VLDRRRVWSIIPNCKRRVGGLSEKAACLIRSAASLVYLFYPAPVSQFSIPSSKQVCVYATGSTGPPDCLPTHLWSRRRPRPPPLLSPGAGRDRLSVIVESSSALGSRSAEGVKGGARGESRPGRTLGALPFLRLFMEMAPQIFL